MTTRDFNSKIQFSNDGQLSFFFVGTGNAFSKSFYQTNCVVVKGNTSILIDCGTLCPFVMNTVYNTPISEVTDILVTHPHADHAGGLEEMALIGKYANHQKINMIINNRFKKRLWNETLAGGLKICEDGVQSFDDYFVQVKPSLVRIKPFEMYEINYGSINLKIFRTKHVVVKSRPRKSQLSYGILFDNRILFTGDTQFNREQLEWFEKNYKIEHIFHDCDVVNLRGGVHATYSELKTLPENIKSKILLFHYHNMIKNVSPAEDGFAGVVAPGIYYDF